jgi:hypothetical protein
VATIKLVRKKSGALFLRYSKTLLERNASSVNVSLIILGIKIIPIYVIVHIYYQKKVSEEKEAFT